jgi:hypothetical protein
LATKNGRVLLVRNRESMVIGPNTVVTLPAGNDSRATTIILGAGQVEFDVEKRNVKHFAVETPVLAAVVKGTHFTVTIGQRSGKVQVSRGRVEVTNLKTGQMVDALAGQKAVVDGRGLTISGYGELSDIVQGVPRAPLLGPLLGEVTAGLGNAVNSATGLLGNLLGGNGLAGSNGLSASVGSNGIAASVGGGSGISASLGGSGGVSVSAGGGGGISVSVGGLSVGLGGGGGLLR